MWFISTGSNRSHCIDRSKELPEYNSLEDESTHPVDLRAAKWHCNRPNCARYASLRLRCSCSSSSVFQRNGLEISAHSSPFASGQITLQTGFVSYTQCTVLTMIAFDFPSSHFLAWILSSKQYCGLPTLQGRRKRVSIKLT